MFNRSAIMTEAWKQYRYIRENYAPWQIERGIVDGSFSAALKTAWRKTKAENARKAEKARFDAAVAASPRAAAIVREIESLRYADTRVNVPVHLAALTAELNRIAA